MNAVSDIAPPQVDLELRGIAKSFGDFVALEAVDLSIERGEFVAIMGPSGCGKTTLLRIVAGLESMSSGRLLLRGQDISALPVHKRSTRLVWQNFALFPHLNVRRNIAFGLTLGRHDKTAVKAKTKPVKKGSGSVNGSVDTVNGGGRASPGGNAPVSGGTHSDPAGN